MLETLTGLARTLAGAGIFCGMALMLLPERSNKKTVQVLCCVMLCMTLLNSLNELKIEELAEGIALQKLNYLQPLSERDDNTWEVYRSIIKQETEAYIWKQAQALGITRLGVRLTLRDGEQSPYPWSIELSGSYSQTQQDALCAVLEGELGIPKERQHWSVSDVD